jgi:GDP-4-dehydro-6-deoxy-D-mannose reductase
MSTLLVTGLSGFVGSYLAGQEGAVNLVRDGRLADLAARGEVEEAVARIQPTAVIHLAAQSSVAQAIDDPAATYRTNFDGTYNLLQALKACNFRGRMLYVGSGDVYGSVAPDNLPVTEDSPLKPRNPYAVSKVAAEALCYQWSQAGPFEVVMARPFNHIGPRQVPTFAVADFARQVVAYRKGRGPGVLQVGDIDATRDFTDVRDIVAAYMELLSRGRNGEAYNVCSDSERSLREIIEGLFEVSGVRMPIVVAAERLRPSEQRRMRGSYRKLRADTGWQPRVPFAQTLADIVDYWEAKEPS